MFPLRRKGMVLGDHGPAIGKQAHVPAPGVDHRLDRECHAGLQFEARVGLSVVQDLRVLVVDPPDTMPAVLAHYRKVARLGKDLNGVPDITQVCARAYLLDAAPHRLEATLGQALRLHRGLANEVHPARITVEALFDDGDIDIDDVAALEHPLARYAVADDVIDRRTDRLRISLVMQVRGYCVLVIHDVVVTQSVKFFRGHAGHDVLADHVQHFGGEATGHAHVILLFGSLDRDVHGGCEGCFAHGGGTVVPVYLTHCSLNKFMV